MLNQIRLRPPSFVTDRQLNALKPRYQAAFPRILFLCDPAGVFDARPEKIALEIFPLDPLQDATRFVQDLLVNFALGGMMMFANDPETGLQLGLVLDFAKFVNPRPPTSIEEARRLAILNSCSPQQQEQETVQVVSEPAEVAPIAPIDDAFSLVWIDEADQSTLTPTYESLAKILSERTGWDIRPAHVEKWMKDSDAADALDVYVADAIVRAEDFPRYPATGVEEKFKQFLQEQLG